MRSVPASGTSLIRGARRIQRVLLLLVLVVLSGCAQAAPSPGASSFIEHRQTPPPEPAQTAAPKTIALVMKTLTNPFFVEMEKGARQAEKELGIHLIVKTAAQETSIEQQIAIVQDLIHAKVDAIVIAPGDSLGLIPVLKQAQDAGIVLINIDNRLDRELAAKLGLAPVPFISVDNEQAAYLAAADISSRIDTPTKAVVLEGIRTAQNAADRNHGILRALRANANVTIVASETAHWKIDEAHEVTKRLFTSTPDIGVIVAANDMMALGAIEYLQETGRTHVLVAGFDALTESHAALRAGTLTVTIDQQAAQQGNLGIHYAASVLAGETVPAETMINVLVVTRATLP